MIGERPKVLLVEDDAFMCSLLSEEFSRSNFEVVIAEDGEKAIQRFSETNPDVVVLDILLPKKNGIEVLREIRKLPRGETAPVIILSNLEEPDYIKNAESLGVKAYLIKANVQLPEIVAKVREAMGK